MSLLSHASQVLHSALGCSLMCRSLAAQPGTVDNPQKMGDSSSWVNDSVTGLQEENSGKYLYPSSGSSGRIKSQLPSIALPMIFILAFSPSLSLSLSDFPLQHNGIISQIN